MNTLWKVEDGHLVVASVSAIAEITSIASDLVFTSVQDMSSSVRNFSTVDHLGILYVALSMASRRNYKTKIKVFQTHIRRLEKLHFGGA